MAHPLSGADLGTLAAVFRDGGAPDAWGRAAGIWAAALARWPATALERALIAPRLEPRGEMAPPVFILGHWRSGTTHLYNVMSLGDWGYVPPVAVGLPHDMFGIGRALRPLLERQLPRHRYIDNIPVTPTSPQEDEIAVANMSPLSFYHGIYFPRAFDRLIDRGLFFEGCSEAEIFRWQERFDYFLRKLSLAQGRRLLIKNPVYTARPALLARMYPGAKFIHIHRNPFDVFLSMRNFYTQLLKVMALQRVPETVDVDATILRVYQRMMSDFETQTAGWGAPDFVELPYRLLDEQPIEALERIYAALELDGFDAARARFAGYLESVRSFRKNAFRGDSDTVAKVSEHWGHWVGKWGYEAPKPHGAAA